MTPDINMVGDLVEPCFDPPYRYFIPGPLHILHGEEKKNAKRVIKKACIRLRITLPSPVMPLAYQKYQMMNNVETVFAFGELLPNRQQMVGHQFSLELALILQKKVFLYDGNSHQWYKGDTFQAHDNRGGFQQINRFRLCDPPNINSSSSFIYNQNLSEEYREALAALLKR